MRPGSERCKKVSATFDRVAWRLQIGASSAFPLSTCSCDRATRFGAGSKYARKSGLQPSAPPADDWPHLREAGRADSSSRATLRSRIVLTLQLIARHEA